VQILRGNGSLLRQSIQDIVTPEDVCNKWEKVTDMTDATVTPSIQVIYEEFLENKDCISLRRIFNSTGSYRKFNDSLGSAQRWKFERNKSVEQRKF
jgi:hypothetical protein